MVPCREYKYRSLQGTYPVISLSIVNAKERDYPTARKKICQMLADLYTDDSFLTNSDALREGNRESFERLMKGEHLFAPIDEQIVYNQLDGNENAVWSLLVASGYLKVIDYEKYETDDIIVEPQYELALTNLEGKLMFKGMIRGWFSRNLSDYNDFVKALLLGDLDAMNEYMNRVACEVFSFFDTGSPCAD